VTEWPSGLGHAAAAVSLAGVPDERLTAVADMATPTSVFLFPAPSLLAREGGCSWLAASGRYREPELRRRYGITRLASEAPAGLGMAAARLTGVRRRAQDTGGRR